ncbi:hypothetical protein PYW07_015011 [Mythimna separata]|uniref:Zinc finger PHD-type domain-containing protein n=1 Tax=Mythimna separata TaxID=271217 RepID=A0AAD7YZ99_MYTSE|nr:hypothetical protein PYW07_015011 [Mythimna separata]
MPNRCGACGSAIAESDDCMECSYGKCKKKYDLACLDINIITFKSYSMSFKKNWVCPECVSLKPKVGNSETPVRINPDFKIYTANTPTNNVTIQRGSQRGSQADLSPTIMNNDSTLLEELREFRADMVARMDSQAKAISLLLNQFSQTKTELDNIVQIMRVLEEKVDAKLSQDKQIQNTIIHEIPDNPPSSTSTFAEVAYQPTGSSKNTYAKKVNKGGATKSALLAENTASITLLAVDEVKKAEMEENESGWTTVRNKKSRQLKEVNVGTNKELTAIQATERKKHLHVWRLHPDTTLEAVTDHVKSICGPESVFKVDKIKHKTERDYSSFIIGVSEHCFAKLNQAESWPMNVEFNEWIWFRKSTKRAPNE